MAVCASASENVLLDCARNYPLADTPLLAATAPQCSWDDYDAHINSAGLDWTDGMLITTQLTSASASGESILLSPSHADLTSILTTALTIVDILRLTLGDETYATYSKPVTVDIIGWAFHWTHREEVDGTSNTVETQQWKSVESETRRIWGNSIGGALKRLLPRVPSVLVRGFGPEAPDLERTSLRDDGWLSLELYSGVYEQLSEPAPTLTLLENSGMHDDMWPSDGGCVSDKGEFALMSHAELQNRTKSGMLEGVGLGCLWRGTIELLRDSGRLIHATSYSSHEHLAAIDNLKGIGAQVVHAYPNGFREEGQKVVHMDLLAFPGPLSASLQDSHPRKFGKQEAMFAATSALWRHRIEVSGYEASPRMSRNSHVLGFRGKQRLDRQSGGLLAVEEYDKLWYESMRGTAIRDRLRQQALAAAELPSMPPRQAFILRSLSWLHPEADMTPPIASHPTEGEFEPSTRGVEAENQFVLAQVHLKYNEKKQAEAAFRLALSLAPDDHETSEGLSELLAQLGYDSQRVELLRSALKLRPTDMRAWRGLGVSLSTMDGEEAAAEEAFRKAAEVSPMDPRGPLGVGRYLAKLSRPAEAIEAFYESAGIDATYFEQVKLSVGTARGQQGRLHEAISNFEVALSLSPDNSKLKRSIEEMHKHAHAVDTVMAGSENAVQDVCGTPCQDIVDASGYRVCAITWADGCGEEPPPHGFERGSTVAELCRQSCAVYVHERMASEV